MFGLRSILKKPTPRPRESDASATDAELVLAARRGDKQAFVEIVARHQAMVCGVAMGILGRLADSEDAAQEAFLTAWRKLHTLREPERLRGWLAQIARNAALGQLRRSHGTEALEEALEKADEAALPDEAAASREEISLVQSSLAKLPEIYRLPLVLFYREGKSIRAVAETLELSEDAVKQRLSRGREMLREEMSDTVEKVLRGTGPTAIFTMSIAVAIGALAAPSAIAGAAFAAASASSASTSSSVLAAMSTSKGLLVTGALVAIACIPIGYQATRNEGANLPVKPMAVSAQPLPAAPPVGLELENSPLLAEWRHLHDVYGRSADAMPALYKAINEMGDPFRRQAFGAALVAEWVQLAPTNGLAFFLVKGRDADQRRQFIREWLQREPKAAVAGLLASPTGWESATRDCLKEIAQQAPASLAAIVSRLPAPEYAWESDVRDAFALLAQSGLATARAQAEAMTGPNRDQALEGISLQWAKQDFNGAVAWAKGLPDDVDKNEVIRAALLGRAQVDPVGALQSVEIVPSGGTWQRFASSTGARVLQQAADTDFDATVAWATANPGHFSRNDIYGLVPQVTTRLDADTAGFLSAHAADGSLAVLSPAIENSLLNGAAGERAAVWDWLKTQPDTATIAGLKKDVLTTAAFQDPALAVSLVADVPTGSEGDAEVKQVAKCLLNGGRALYRYDELAAEAPERLRQPLLAAAFQELSGEYMGNPQTWIDRLSQLPAAERSQGAASIGRAWGEQAPEDAIAWAAALPAGDLRSSAESAAVAQWAKKDPQGALDWVTQLPAGTDKDSSATSLIGAIAEQFPQQAWDLALNMSDPAQQIKGATSAAKLIAARDPATARAWVEGSSLPAEAKLQIQTALQQSKK